MPQYISFPYNANQQVEIKNAVAPNVIVLWTAQIYGSKRPFQIHLHFATESCITLLTSK